MASVIFRTIGGRVVPIKVSDGTPGSYPDQRAGARAGASAGAGIGSGRSNPGGGIGASAGAGAGAGIGSGRSGGQAGAAAGRRSGRGRSQNPGRADGGPEPYADVVSGMYPFGLHYGRGLQARVGDPTLYRQAQRIATGFPGTGMGAQGAGAGAEVALGAAQDSLRNPPIKVVIPPSMDAAGNTVPRQVGTQQVPTKAQPFTGAGAAALSVAAMGTDIYFRTRRGESGRRAFIGAGGGFLGGFAGGYVGAQGGAMAGAAAGAAIGSVVPVIGTAAGAAVGATAGAVIGGFGGGFVGGIAGARATVRADEAINPGGASIGWRGQDIQNNSRGGRF